MAPVDDDGRQIAWVDHGEQFLKVVYSVEEDDVVVITTGPRKQLPEELLK